MSMLLRGASAAAALNEKPAQLVSGLREKGVVPTLAIVRLGAREAGLSYERAAVKRCAAVGIETRCVSLPENASGEALEETLRSLSADASVHGILLLRPLPAALDEARILRAIAPEKDVDGITDGSMAGVFTNMPIGYPPCTAQACLEILKYYNVPLSGKRAVVVGRSLVVGKPAARMLDRENATVTLCNSRTRDLPALCREADVLGVALGRRGAIGADCLREGQVVVVGGIHVNEEGKLCGDVRFDEAEPIVEAVTPVPGGVGTVTTSVLVGHVVDAASAQ